MPDGSASIDEHAGTSFVIADAFPKFRRWVSRAVGRESLRYPGRGDSMLYWFVLGILIMIIPDSSPNAADSHAERERVLADFGAHGADLGWHVVNDDVMGGKSEGRFRQEEGRLVFSGRTNTDGGGFSSIRTKTTPMDLSSYDGIRLHLKGDGRRYTWRLTTAARWRGRPISYWADFGTRGGEWQTVDIPFSAFIPRHRGYRLDGPAFDPGEVRDMGLMIYDRRDGPFELQLAGVRAYAEAPPFALSAYRWEYRVLVLSAPREDDPRMREQQDNVASTARAFADRDMVLVTLLDTPASTAGNRQLTREETALVRAALDIPPDSFAVRLIGKDGTVKLSAKDPVSMSEIYALIDTMPMRRSEIKDR